jgi:trehalose utilization protein
MPHVTVWNEYKNERGRVPQAAEQYPDGLHEAIAEGLGERGLSVETATRHDPEHGLTEAVLDRTDVLAWFGHSAHDEVGDAVVERVKERVLDGMGLIVLHSGQGSRIFTELMGTRCTLKWRNQTEHPGEKERLWVVEPSHPIADGVDEYFEIPQAEAFGEPFEIPAPDTLVFVSWFEGGDVCRSGCCYRRGQGKVFYFRPGHEAHPVYYQSEVRRVLANAARWATPDAAADHEVTDREPLEPVESTAGMETDTIDPDWE